MHVACAGCWGGVNVGRRKPLKGVNGSVRKWQDLSEELVKFPWKSPPIRMVWFGRVIVSVPSAMHAAACSARSCGR